MYPAPYDYRQVSTVTEAINLLAEADGDAKVLAGGQGLIPDMKTGVETPDMLVDIGDIDRLHTIESTDDVVVIGAMVTHAELATSDRLQEHSPILSETAQTVADRQIRNRGTVGGNLAEADPEADLPAAMLAVGATFDVEGPEGTREIPATEFFVDSGETALAAEEMVTAIRVPSSDGGAYLKRTHPARGYAMVGVAIALDVTRETLEAARVATVGVADRPIRLPTVEAELAGTSIESIPDGPVVAQATQQAETDLEDCALHGDAYASGAFRAALLPTLLGRAVETAIERTTEGRLQ